MSMTAGQLATTIGEAKRFLQKAEALHAETLRHNKELAEVSAGKRDYWDYHDVSPKDSGAVRRASMDLTRSLADLRRV